MKKHGIWIENSKQFAMIDGKKTELQGHDVTKRNHWRYSIHDDPAINRLEWKKCVCVMTSQQMIDEGINYLNNAFDNTDIPEVKDGIKKTSDKFMVASLTMLANNLGVKL